MTESPDCVSGRGFLLPRLPQRGQQLVTASENIY
jgi:hypothetical protein